MNKRNTLIQAAKQTKFESKVIGKSVESKYSGNIKLLYLLWMTELQDWLRTVHNIHVSAYPFEFAEELDGTYSYSLFANREFISDECDLGSYDEALETGLLGALKLINDETIRS